MYPGGGGQNFSAQTSRGGTFSARRRRGGARFQCTGIWEFLHPPRYTLIMTAPLLTIKTLFVHWSE